MYLRVWSNDEPRDRRGKEVEEMLLTLRKRSGMLTILT